MLFRIVNNYWLESNTDIERFWHDSNVCIFRIIQKFTLDLKTVEERTK